MGPVSEFSFKNNAERLVRLLNEDGMGPVIEVSDK